MGVKETAMHQLKDAVSKTSGLPINFAEARLFYDLLEKDMKTEDAAERYEEKDGIKINDEDVREIEHRLNAALSNLMNCTPIVKFMLDKTEVQMLLGLIEEHRLRTHDDKYRAGMLDGYLTAKKEMIRKIGKMRMKK